MGFGGKLFYGFNILIFVSKFRDFGSFFYEFRQIYIRFQRKKNGFLISLKLGTNQVLVRKKYKKKIVLSEKVSYGFKNRFRVLKFW